MSYTRKQAPKIPHTCNQNLKAIYEEGKEKEEGHYFESEGYGFSDFAHIDKDGTIPMYKDTDKYYCVSFGYLSGVLDYDLIREGKACSVCKRLFKTVN